MDGVGWIVGDWSASAGGGSGAAWCGWRRGVCHSPSCVIIPLVEATAMILLGIREHSIHPRPLGDAAIRIIDSALPVRLVIDGVDLAGVRTPLAGP